MDDFGGASFVEGVGRPEQARTGAVLFSILCTVGFALVCAHTTGSDGRSAALLVAANFLWFVGFAVWSRDRAFGRLLLATLACGWTELLADVLCVRCTGTLDYSPTGSTMVLDSPWWMPFLWAVVAVQIGVVGYAAIRRFGGIRGVLLTGGLGAVLIPVYEHLAWGSHWWRYRNCLLLGHVPVYIVVAEAVIGVGLALLGYLVLRGSSWRTAVLLGVATGGWMIFGGVVGWGTVEFLGRHARPLWLFR